MKPQDKATIGDNVTRIVRILLARDEMLQKDLAAGLDYDPGTITRSMQGDRKWTLDDLVNMAEFFEVPVSMFFEDPQYILVRTAKSAITDSDGGSEKYLVTDHVLVAA